jgi:hypothetical protein
MVLDMIKIEEQLDRLNVYEILRFIIIITGIIEVKGSMIEALNCITFPNWVLDCICRQNSEFMSIRCDDLTSIKVSKLEETIMRC